MLLRSSRTKIVFIPVIYILWAALRVVVILLTVVLFVVKSSVRIVIYLPGVSTAVNTLLANATLLAFLKSNIGEV